jgi:nucleotide-binding universal stress UspA family protein
MLARQATEADVECTGKALFHGNTAQSIVDTARHDDCDLVVMGSHGRSGLSRMFLGSVTGKVLALSDKPVLVHRATPAGLDAAQKLMAVGGDADAPE